MTYDQWKCTDPRDYEPEEECYHENFEIDMEGRAHCNFCSESWRASVREIEEQRAIEAEFNAWCRKQERREFWRKLTLPIRWPIFRLLELIWPRRSLIVLTDDEIPF